MHIAQEQVSQPKCRTLRTGGFFQKLSPAALAYLTSIRVPTSYDAGDILFSEKQEATGVFLVREGLVRLSMNSSDGKRGQGRGSARAYLGALWNEV
jgi:CRP-like cAMP-binding protein